MSEPILKVVGLKKYFPIRGGLFSAKLGEVKAVQDVTFDLNEGETLGLVGESGCGKSTLGRAIMRLEEPTAGDVIFEGRSLIHCSNRELFELRPNFQMIFQDPYSSLNPRMTIGEIIREPLDIHRIGDRADRTERTAELLESVGLRAEMAGRYPHEFSGGQRQRVGIARTLALKPKLIVADEPLSALDVSVQAQVINLMVSLQKSLGLTYIFISHDLSVVEYISDRIAVMYLGRIVEIGPKRSVFDRPAHPYTRALIEAVPVADPRRRRKAAPIRGETPSAVNPPSGGAFHPRCPYAVDECALQLPTLEQVTGAGKPQHLVACLRKDEI